MPNPIKVSVYEDSIPLLEGLTELIAAQENFLLSGAHVHPKDVLKDMKKERPDVVLMDIEMPGMSGIEATRLIHQNFPEIKVLIQTVFEEDDKVFQSICNGAVGYILKKTPPKQLLQAISDAASGGAPMSPGIAVKVLHLLRAQSNHSAQEPVSLSPREKEILTFLTRGLSYKMIAAECHISIDTVRFHIKSIYDILHVHNMSGAVAKALKDKLV